MSLDSNNDKESKDQHIENSEDIFPNDFDLPERKTFENDKLDKTDNAEEKSPSESQASLDDPLTVGISKKALEMFKKEEELKALEEFKKTNNVGGKHRQKNKFQKFKEKYSKTWYIASIVVMSLLLSTLIKVFVFQTFYVPSESMTNTLQVGDRIIASKISYYFSDPKPGDIIVFKDPGGWLNNDNVPEENILQKALSTVGLLPSNDKEYLVKRIIAVGGEKVKCCSPDGNIQVSDDDGKTWKELYEPYLKSELPFIPELNTDSKSNINIMETTSTRNFPPITVPTGRVFVLGDNRANSKDSLWHYRFEFEGNATKSTVPVGNIVGKVTNIIWPKSRWESMPNIDIFKEGN